jgi:hypothetical protein
MVVEEVSESKRVKVRDVVADDDCSARGRNQLAASPILLHDEIEKWSKEEGDDLEDGGNAERAPLRRREVDLSRSPAAH